jgi:hypothetical protein
VDLSHHRLEFVERKVGILVFVEFFEDIVDIHLGVFDEALNLLYDFLGAHFIKHLVFFVVFEVRPENL